MTLRILVGIACLLPLAAAADDGPVPATVGELVAGVDPRAEPLAVEVVREWTAEGIVFRTVTFHVGTFQGTAARMAAFYAFPAGAVGAPGLLHLHGGGQRAFLHEVAFHAGRGYACLSINWGGREMEEARAGDPNTDWGAVDPTQRDVAGYFNLLPGPRHLDPVESPRNNNWYLLTLAARRGLTFLERQPEVDPARLGVYGHSMGGSLTVYVAGSDERVKAAAPSVGGSGFRTRPMPLVPSVRLETPRGDLDLFEATLGFESYAPRIACPTLWLGATNDFHGIIDDTYRTGALIPHAAVRYAFTPHMNHRFTPEYAVTRTLWFEQHLRGTFAFPRTPQTRCFVAPDDGIPGFEVVADPALPVAEVAILYSVDPDPRARYWRSATATRHEGHRWTAALPIPAGERPLFAFANVTYELPRPEAAPWSPPTGRCAISSLLHTITAAELAAAGARATDRPTPVIDDFAHGWRDWYALSPDNPHHWEFSTRKLSDPTWRGGPGQRLAIEVRAERPNTLVIVLVEHVFGAGGGPQREFVAAVALHGGADFQTLELAASDFTAADGAALASWHDVDLLSLRAYHERGDSLVGSRAWEGPQPVFRALRWTGPEQ